MLAGVVLLVLFLSGCSFGGGSSVAIKDRKVKCPVEPPVPTCTEENAGTIADYERFLEHCRAETDYWRKGWNAC